MPKKPTPQTKPAAATTDDPRPRKGGSYYFVDGKLTPSARPETTPAKTDTGNTDPATTDKGDA